jgi:hypothetical protein
MQTYFFVTAAAVQGRTTSSPPCSTIDEALRGANFMLGNGADSVWIVDGGGNLVLPPEQVRIRLKPQGLSATETAVG